MNIQSSPPAPANQPIEREAVRLLAIEHGVREAARMTGLNEDRVRQWSHRFRWLHNSQGAKSNGAVTSVTTRPSDAHVEALAHHEGQTRLTLAKYASNAAAAIHKSVHPTRYTKQARDIAGVMATVHKQDQDKPGAQFSLNVLNLNMFSDTDGPTLD